ncbi:DNA-binding transcriptional MerR regulator [Scopulibacillus darangshiensis]|uniref:DNA-binding transcriptional MerR regulator n=1 Tax=Scopulibacillus darangshiensis TaxID=442528 RepID=A0A4R2NJ96_9BACL|nr:MerR family transcriptional regulator [Scopulibacillus darangshiensis]TCP21491.1 DNA-binding transcriptional MerR regulator [Scopulibacillus darangshiensis]
MNISEVSGKFGLTPDTLRYYEKIGLIPPVNRTAGGVRAYSEHDLNWIDFVMCMRNAGLSIEVLQNYLKLFEQGDSSLQERKEILIEQRQVLAEKIRALQDTVERLDHKIEGYNGQLLEAEHELQNKMVKK